MASLKTVPGSTITAQSGFAQEVIDGTPEHWRILLDDCPDDFEIDAEVVVNDLVSQAGDVFPGDLRVQ